MYAVIEDSGTQLKVAQGDVVKVDLRDLPADQATISFDRVLMVGHAQDPAQMKLGVPYVAGAKVLADVLASELAPRVEVVKFKRRCNYRRRKGHRQGYLKVKITSIQVA